MARALRFLFLQVALSMCHATRLREMSRGIMDLGVFESYVVGELHAAANAIEAVTKETDTLLFLGQSPAYVQSAVACNRHNTLRIAGSGMSSLNKKGLQSLPAEQLDGYCGYLSETADAAGIDLAGAVQRGEIVTIDLSETGKSVTFFAKLLRRCYPDFKRPMRFIDLAIDTRGALMGFNPDLEYVKTEQIIVLRHAGALAWDGVPRIVPSWKITDWTAEGPDSTSIGQLAAEFDAAVRSQCGTREGGDGVIAVKPSNPEDLRAMRVQFNTELCTHWPDALFC